MKNILLIGDSIRAGYDKSVKESMGSEYNVIFPEDNCRFAAYLFRHFHEYFMYLDLKGEQIDLIHWNAGLWDCLRLFEEEPQTPIEIYEYYIDRICKRIKKLCPNAKVIFATSTSVMEERMPSHFKRYNKEIQQYNMAAVNIVKKYGFEVNDLYEVSLMLPEDAHSDDVHFYTPMGTEAFTKQVLKRIAEVMGLEKVPEYKEVLYTSKPVGR